MTHNSGDLQARRERAGGGWLTLPRPQHNHQHSGNKSNQNHQKEGHDDDSTAVGRLVLPANFHQSLISVGAVEQRGEGWRGRRAQGRELVWI